MWKVTFLASFSQSIASQITQKDSLLKLRKSKWLLFGAYYPPSQNDQYYLDCLDKALDLYSSSEKVILTGDFNA